MKKYFLVNTTIPGSIFLSLLMGGCAIQPAKSRTPAQLEREIKTIEDVKSTTAYQPPVSGEKTTYIVKKGDTLWRIANNYGVSVETILRANHIPNTKDLKVGQKLIIPASGKSYTSPATHSSYTPASNITGGISSKGFIWPVKGQVVSQFGEMRNGAKNMGIYILPQPGQNVVAAKKGAVEAVTDADDGTLVIIIKHDGGSRTIYGCRSNPMVGEGSYVEQGQPIASISQTSTGNSTEINFKIYVKDKPVNPLSYLP
ncbi:MAG: LysM peptidoglycan-binding domain-containing protein [Candidatus Brocadiaceae bacterium]|nr:LysM peptidoglycan-binding domain-containing protein [Candidatus Brocadiaceae bacterium]